MGTERYNAHMEDNRSRLLYCALELFAARGYDAVGVQEVVEATGLTKPTLYHYFGSKNGLLKTLLDEGISELFAALEPASAYNRALAPTLEAITRAYFGFAGSQPRFYRLLLALWFAPPEGEAFKAVLVIHQKQHQIMEAFFLRAAEDHGNLKGRHQAYAATFLGLLNTYISIGLNGYIILDEKLARSAVHQFMHGIFA